MKLTAVCCTYLRPVQLASVITCFMAQDYPQRDRELIILDDAGQYDNQQGDGWRLVSTDCRYPSLGDKRNALMGLVSDDTDAVAIWDDDDLYLPWAIRASVRALEHAPWSRPSTIWEISPDGSWRHRPTKGEFQAAWAYRMEAYRAAGDYPSISHAEDEWLRNRFGELGITEADPVAMGFPPFFVWGTRSPWSPPWHISFLGSGNRGYEKVAVADVEKVSLEIPASIDWSFLPREVQSWISE